jgi:hypothetical protein
LFPLPGRGAPGAAIRLAVVPRPAPKRVKKSRQRLNALDTKELVFGPATLLLLVSFWLPWYSFNPGSISPISVDGLTVHGWLFIAVLDSIVLVLYILITAFGVGDLATQGRMSKDQLLALITGVNLALVVLASWLFCRSAFRSFRPAAGAEAGAPRPAPVRPAERRPIHCAPVCPPSLRVTLCPGPAVAHGSASIRNRPHR